MKEHVVGKNIPVCMCGGEEGGGCSKYRICITC